ncbi:MAG: HAD-IIIA family hydrolase [Alphaproteobacteria bacterium]|nr:HAD-IIIA family hydrolase [Alphaproteobacteria bacterium]
MGIKLLALDVDGVMTDGTIYYTAEGEEIKAFNAQDGMGIKFLRKAGIEVAVISGRNSRPLNKRLDDLGVKHRRLKCGNKVRALEEICAEISCKLEDAAFMGDDLIDLQVMQAAGYALAPLNAVAEVKAVAHHVTKARGGEGAVREACEHIAALIGVRFVDLLDPENRL